MLKLLVLHYVWNGCNSQNKINKPYPKNTKPTLQKKIHNIPVILNFT